MKKILQYLKTFLKEEFHPGLYLLVGLFLGLALWANYTWNLESRYVDQFNRQWVQIPVYFLFYSLPYLFTLLAWAMLTRNTHLLRQKGLWATLFFAFLLLSLNSWFHYYQYLSRELFEPSARLWASKLFWNMKSSLFYLIPLFIFWRLYDRKEMDSFYGLTRRNFDPRPYFFMLLVVLPLIIWASFQPDFLNAYPHYRPGRAEASLGWSPWVTTGLLQFFYGLDFTFVELFFRGFLVIGMVKWLGKGAILPMTATYCFLHFGKPMGEAISSIFGGYLLGIFAWYSRSVLGGVIVHWGLAWMMELWAYLQIFVFQK